MHQNDEMYDDYINALGALKADCVMAEAISRTGVDASDVELIKVALSCLDDVLEHHGFERRG